MATFYGITGDEYFNHSYQSAVLLKLRMVILLFLPSLPNNGEIQLGLRPEHLLINQQNPLFRANVDFIEAFRG